MKTKQIDEATEYTDFLHSKQYTLAPGGIEITEDTINPLLYDFQKAIVKWACRKGRAAVFADCGLGKTLIQLEWARLMTRRSLIIAPLCVAKQTITEAKKLNQAVHFVRNQNEIQEGINITNYEMVDNFTDDIDAVVLDESSILKSLAGKTRKKLIEIFKNVPYRLCCTATPCPNDIAELGNHSEFLGILTYPEMLASFFVNKADKGMGWVMKGYAHDAFYKWLASWAVCLNNPEDLGFDGSKFILPDLNIEHVEIPITLRREGELFFMGLKGIQDRLKIRRETVEARVNVVYWFITKNNLTLEPGVDIVNKNKKGDMSCIEPQNKKKNICVNTIESIETNGIKELQKNKPSITLPEKKDTHLIQNIEKSCEPYQETEIKRARETDALSPIMGLPNKTIKICSYPKGGCVPFVEQLKVTEQIEKCTLTTAILPGKSEDCFVPTVIRGLENLKTVLNYSKEQYLIYCGLNEEQDRMAKLFGDDCFSVYGSLSIEEKEDRITRWLNNERPVIISKPRILGWGVNFQQCHNVVFIGLSDSYESYYQCIRRAWRFGQTKPVNAYVILTDAEREIYQNVKRKELEAGNMSKELVKNIEEFERMEIHGSEKKTDIETVKYHGKSWELYNGDAVDVTMQLPENSIDFSIYSPPFISLYTYSATERDMGNTKNEEEFFNHYRFLIRNLLKITKTGRNTAVHVSQVPAMLIKDGYIGLKDFRGEVVRQYEKEGWIYHGEIVISKNPQAQAVRTKSKSLLFVQLKRDSSWLRPGLADYILLFRKPGENKIPILPKDISNEDWIKWAHPVWLDIRENHTLNKCEARSDKDERHVCPLQLDVIDRCVRLWSNVRETILSPFAGIGSEGYQSILRGRKFIGIELKPEYAKVAIDNLNKADQEIGQNDLFQKEAIL